MNNQTLPFSKVIPLRQASILPKRIKVLNGGLILVSLLLLISQCTQRNKVTLTIAVAANMQYVIQPIIEKFTETTGISCQTILSSSGKLTAQIKEGAPFDVFLSADMKFPNQLLAEGITNQIPQVFAYGHLVLWSSHLSPIDITALRQRTVKKIAIANPKTAPYGQAALEILQFYHLVESVQKKLVYGESIAQTNQFIISGAADIGITAKSVVLAPHLKQKGTWVALDTAAYQPIEQGIVVIKQQMATQRFFNFMFSKTAQDILHRFGYDKIDNAHK